MQDSDNDGLADGWMEGLLLTAVAVFAVILWLSGAQPAAIGLLVFLNPLTADLLIASSFVRHWPPQKRAGLPGSADKQALNRALLRITGASFAVQALVSVFTGPNLVIIGFWFVITGPALIPIALVVSKAPRTV